jgi:hypothetical protein
VHLQHISQLQVFHLQVEIHQGSFLKFINIDLPNEFGIQGNIFCNFILQSNNCSQFRYDYIPPTSFNLPSSSANKRASYFGSSSSNFAKPLYNKFGFALTDENGKTSSPFNSGSTLPFTATSIPLPISFTRRKGDNNNNRDSFDKRKPYDRYGYDRGGNGDTLFRPSKGSGLMVGGASGDNGLILSTGSGSTGGDERGSGSNKWNRYTPLQLDRERYSIHYSDRDKNDKLLSQMLDKGEEGLSLQQKMQIHELLYSNKTKYGDDARQLSGF